MSLRKSFEAVNQAQLKYVVLNDDRKLPEIAPLADGQLRILVESDHREKFINLFDLTSNHPTLRDKCELFSHPECRIPIRLLTKGRGYFPETFETGLLATLHMVNKCVPSISSMNLLFAVLYEHVYHGVPISQRVQNIFVDSLKQRGLGKTIYKNPHRPIARRKPRIEDIAPTDVTKDTASKDTASKDIAEIVANA